MCRRGFRDDPTDTESPEGFVDLMSIASELDDMYGDWMERRDGRLEFASGKTVNQSVPTLFMTMKEFDELAAKDEDLKPAAEKWISVGGSHIISGASKLGKSTLMFDLAVSLSTGHKWLNHITTTQMPVYLLDFENRPRYAHRHINDSCEAKGLTRGAIDSHLFIASRDKLVDDGRNGFNADQTIADIRGIVQRTGNDHGIFVVDTMREAFSGLDGFEGEWEWKSSSVREAKREIYRVIDATGWGFIGIHHDTKSGSSPSGSGDWAGAFDCVLHYTGNAYSSSARTLTFAGRENPKPDPLIVTYTPGKGLQANDKKGNPKPSPNEESHGKEGVFQMCYQEILKDGSELKKGDVRDRVISLATSRFKVTLGRDWIDKSIGEEVKAGHLIERQDGPSKLLSLPV